MGNTNNNLKHIKWILAALLVVVLVGGAYMFGTAKASTTVPSNTQQEINTAGASTCPTSAGTTATLTLYNGQDPSAGTFDATGYFLDADGGVAVTVTDTTTGTATINCGIEYKFALVAQDGDGNDNSYIRSVSSSGGETVANADGTVSLKATAIAMNMNLVGSKHGIMQAKLFDNNNNGYFYESSTATQGAFIGTGKTFTSTTNNATATNITAQNGLDVTLKFESTSQTTAAADEYGYYILVTAAATGYQQPTMTLNGQTLSTTTLTGKDAQLYGTTYQYAYKVNSIISSNQQSLEAVIKALPGVKPSTNVSIAFAPIGNYLGSTAPITVKNGAATDVAAATAVYTVQAWTIGVSS